MPIVLPSSRTGDWSASAKAMPGLAGVILGGGGTSRNVLGYIWSHIDSGLFLSFSFLSCSYLTWSDGHWLSSRPSFFVVKTFTLYIHESCRRCWPASSNFHLFIYWSSSSSSSPFCWPWCIVQTGPSADHPGARQWGYLSSFQTLSASQDAAIFLLGLLLLRYWWWWWLERVWLRSCVGPFLSLLDKYKHVLLLWRLECRLRHPVQYVNNLFLEVGIDFHIAAAPVAM